MKKILILNEPQPATNELVTKFFPEKIEINDGYLGYNKDEQENMFLALAHTIGIKRIWELIHENSVRNNLLSKMLSDYNSMITDARQEQNLTKAIKLAVMGIKEGIPVEAMAEITEFPEEFLKKEMEKEHED